MTPKTMPDQLVDVHYEVLHEPEEVVETAGVVD
jgi:hypothetical protein